MTSLKSILKRCGRRRLLCCRLFGGRYVAADDQNSFRTFSLSLVDRRTNDNGREPTHTPAVAPHRPRRRSRNASEELGSFPLDWFQHRRATMTKCRGRTSVLGAAPRSARAGTFRSRSRRESATGAAAPALRRRARPRGNAHVHDPGPDERACPSSSRRTVSAVARGKNSPHEKISTRPYVRTRMIQIRNTRSPLFSYKITCLSVTVAFCNKKMVKRFHKSVHQKYLIMRCSNHNVIKNNTNIKTTLYRENSARQVQRVFRMSLFTDTFYK